MWNDKKVAMVDMVWSVAWVLGLYGRILLRKKKEKLLVYFLVNSWYT